MPNTPGEFNYWLRQPVGRLTSDEPDLALDLRQQISGRSVALS